MCVEILKRTRNLVTVLLKSYQPCLFGLDRGIPQVGPVVVVFFLWDPGPPARSRRRRFFPGVQLRSPVVHGR